MTSIPAGRSRSWTEPAPVVLDAKIAIEEGGTSFLLVHGQRPTTQIALTHLSNGGDPLLGYIIATLARINKYGEPAFGLRKAVVSAGRFLAGDLAKVPFETTPEIPAGVPARNPEPAAAPARPPSSAPRLLAPAPQPKIKLTLPTPQARLALPPLGGDPVGTRGAAPPPALPAPSAVSATAADRTRQIAWMGASSQQLLRASLQNAVQPTGERLRAAWAAAKLGKNELALDPYDLANATLDLMLSMDDKGALHGIFNLRACYKCAADGLVPALVQLAAERQIFGGSAPPGSPRDVIGCKAFTLLVRLSDPRVEGGGKEMRVPLEGYIESLIDAAGSKADGAGLRARIQVAQSALILAGIGDAVEARARARGILDLASHWNNLAENRYPRPDSPPPSGAPIFRMKRDLYLVLLRDLRVFLRGAAQPSFAAAVDTYWRETKDSLDRVAALKVPDTSDIVSRRMFYESWNARKTDYDARVAEPLCIPAGTPPRVLIFVMADPVPLLVGKLYMKVPLAIALAFVEPYAGDSYPVTLDTGGGQIALEAHPANDARTLFETGTFEIGDNP